MIINNFSFLLAMVHTFLIFLLLLRTRFSAKKTIKLCLAFLLPVILINIPLAILFEDTVYDLLEPWMLPIFLSLHLQEES